MANAIPPERFKNFFEQFNLPMEVYDLEGNPVEVNQAWVDLFQTTRDELEGYNVLTDPSSKETGLYDYLVRAYGGEFVEVPAFYLDPAKLGKVGRARWIEAWLSPLKDEQGTVMELAIILKDVTEVKEKEATLVRSISESQTSKEKLRLISDRLSIAVKVGKIGIWEWKPGTDHVYWDETLEEIYGYEPGTFSGRLEDYTKGQHPEDREHMWTVINKSQQEKTSYLVEHRIVRRDGKVRWVQGSGTTFFDSLGQPALMIGTAMDITERKTAALDQEFLSRATETLSASFDFKINLQKMSEAAAQYFCDGCFVDQLRPDGSIVRIVVVHPDVLLREKLAQVHQNHPHRYTLDHPLFTTLVTGKTVCYQEVEPVIQLLKEKYGFGYYDEVNQLNLQSMIVARLKGRENLLGTLSFFTVKGSSHVFDDRTKWLVEELAYRTSVTLENSLLYAYSQEAIRARDEFLSIASHELKTPLTSLALQNQMLKKQLAKNDTNPVTPQKLQSVLEADERQLKRINRLIDDMLDITRIRVERLTINKEEFEFSAFIKEVVQRFLPQIEAAGCKITLKLTPDIRISADLHRIEQIVVNMLSNAMKYGEGKPIYIETRVSPHKVSLVVQDQGRGIAPQDIERIFKRFERAQVGREISGLGLGLYISREIALQHKGNLYVQSKVGEGSTFVLDLPL